MNKRDVVSAALALAEDVTAGQIDPATLDAELVQRCRELFGRAVGREDSLWPLQNDVCRQVLALGGVGVDELQEWLAVARQRAQDAEIHSGGTDHIGDDKPTLREPFRDESQVKESD